MKKAGIVILILGIVITIFTGINFVTEEEVLEVGGLEVTREKEHNFDWSPLVGVGVIVAGGVIYLLGRKR